MEKSKIGKKGISQLFKKSDTKSLKTWEGSKFYINNIGPEIAKLLTMVEGVNYYYKTVKYHGVKQFVDHCEVDTVYYNGHCSIVTTKDDLAISENGYIGAFFDGKDTVCLATSEFELPPDYHDGKLYRTPRLDYPNNVIHFYDDEGNQVVLFKNFPYVYDFIDLAIAKQAESHSEYLSRMEYSELLYQVAMAEMQKRYAQPEQGQRVHVQGEPMQRRRVNDGNNKNS